MAKLKLSFPTLKPLPEVVCGHGALSAIREIEDFSNVVFFVSASPVIENGIERALRKRKLQLADLRVCKKPPGEPTESSIAAGRDFLRNGAVKHIVAIGGGSVLDWARLAMREAQIQCPLWLAPSTCGTGAEAGDVAVYTNQQGRKVAVVDTAFRADRVILDGSLLAGWAATPSALTPYLADALSHALEGALSIVPTHIAKTVGISAIDSILQNYDSDSELPHAALDRLLEASYLAGITSANCSVGIAHAFAHSVSMYGIGHGAANALALQSMLRFNAETSQMAFVLNGLKMQSVADLVQAISPIVKSAAVEPYTGELLSVLDNDDERERIATALQEDVAIRTNPRRPTAQDTLDFLQDVRQELSSWNTT